MINQLHIDDLIERIESRTLVSKAKLLGKTVQETTSDGWHFDDRKVLYEDYWGETIFNEASKQIEANNINFDMLWNHLNMHELYFGSSASKILRPPKKKIRYKKIKKLLNPFKIVKKLLSPKEKFRNRVCV